MAPEIDDALLERAVQGDEAALSALFNAYGPYLRAVVRRRLSDRLRSKLDSDDVIQSVWVQVVKQFRRDALQKVRPAELRGLLATIARRRLIDRARQHAPAIAAAPPDVPDPDTFAGRDQARPSQEAVAGDLWRRMLAMCPPEHRPILQLRREGYHLQEIADRTGMHEGSVRRVLRSLARELALGEGSGE